MINTDLIKERVSLEDAFEFLGMDWPRSKKIFCPFHDERTPSCHLYADKGRVWCFGCLKGGDVIDFVMAVKGWSFTEAATQLAQFANITDYGLDQPVPKDRGPDELFPAVENQAHADVLKWVRREGQRPAAFLDVVFEAYDEIMRQHRNKEITSATAIKRLLEWRAGWKSRLA